MTRLARTPMTPQPTYRILGVDPGWANTGWAIVERPFDTLVGPSHCIALGVVRTKKADKKVMRNLRVSADDQRRLAEWHQEMVRVILEYQPRVLAYEVYQPFSNRLGGNAWKTARMEGAVQLLGLERRLAVMPFLPVDLKKGFTGGRSASKEEIFDAVAQRVYGFGTLASTRRKGDLEHIGDAAGHAELAFTEVQGMRQLGVFR